MKRIKIEVSHDNGKTWIALTRHARAVALAGVKAKGYFLALLRSGAIVVIGAAQYRASKGS